MNYGKTPHFDGYASFFEDVYTRSWRTLVELNEHMLRWFLETLGMQVNFLKASEQGFQGKQVRSRPGYVSPTEGEFLHFWHTRKGLR